MKKSPLHRRVNTRTRNVHHDFGGDYRHERNRAEQPEGPRASMHGKKERGLDYTPLFKFLLSKVGGRWDEIFSEAVSRLDKKEPIFWLVALNEADKRDRVCIGESTYYSGLYVDQTGLLQVVDPTLTVERLAPTCPCCTHTFNGVPFTQKYAPPIRGAR